MASMSEIHIMADSQPQQQISNTEQDTNTMNEAATNDNQRQQAELALGLSAGDADGSAMQDHHLEAVLPVNRDATGDIRHEQNAIETNQAAHKAVILTLPSPPLIRPQAGDWVVHRPELRWQARDDYVFYREPGYATQSSTTGYKAEGAVDVYWKSSGYFSWYYPTEKEQKAEKHMDKVIWDDGFSFYHSPALGYHPVYHDLVTDQRYYFHNRQCPDDPTKAAGSAAREIMTRMMSDQENFEPSVLPWNFAVESFPTSLFYPDAVTSPIEAKSTAQKDVAVKDEDLAVKILDGDVVIGVKRPAPVTPERNQPPYKKAKTTPSTPTVHEAEEATSPIIQWPVSPRTLHGFPKGVTIQHQAYILDLYNIEREPLIRGREPEVVFKVMFDKTESLWKPEFQRQTFPTTTAAQVPTNSGTRTPSASLRSTGSSQENPISLDTPERKVCTPRVGTVNNPIPIEQGIADEDVMVILPMGSSTGPATSSTLGTLPVTPRRTFAPSPDPFPPRITRSAEKKTPTPPHRDGFKFYNTNNKALLRYQQVDKDPGVVPGTHLADGRQPDRLLIQKFRNDSNNTKGATNNFSPRKAAIHPKHTPLHSAEYWDNWLKTKHAMPTQPTGSTDPFTAAARQRWIDDAPRSYGQPALLRGFPMVEVVTFLRANNRRDEGNCYWNALSMHMYGRPDFGVRVKLEHLRHVEAVLMNPQHPRHEAYTKINARFFQTNAEGLSGGPFVANMWQILHLPGSWTPSWMTQITADVYGVFVVLYTLKTEKRLLVTETTTRGVYNSRHIFLLFVDGNHYQPMIPNEYDPSEFRCPRPSKDLTRAYVFGDSKRWGDGVTHGWRHDASFGNRVPMPLPVDHNMGATFTDTDRLIKAVVEGGTGFWTAKL
ncbi:hypothetical protein PspLS_05081 [Pyricularia sp. CBS 133598]|nr:hypothetical protein PspLS_05081 [Pyricularia sp. CBS 133598]